MADLRDNAGEYKTGEGQQAAGEEIEAGVVYYPGLLAELTEIAAEYQESLIEQQLFGVCESGETAMG